MFDLTESDLTGFNVDLPDGWAAHIDTALNQLNELTCNAFTPMEQTSYSLPVINIVDDHAIVCLPAWVQAGSVTVDATPDPVEVDYVDARADRDPDGSITSQYARILRLSYETSLPEIGGSVLVTGLFGFQALPLDARAFLAHYVTALASAATGDGSIRSKQIEDVSVTRFDDANDTTPLGTVLSGFRDMVRRWSLCHTDVLSQPLGRLDYPTRDCSSSRPWWLGEVGR